MRETWYVLEDGSSADPRHVAHDDKGALRHKDGMAVAIRPDGNPSSRGVDVDDEAKKPVDKPATKAKEAHSPNDRQMKAGKGAEYKTR